MRQHLVDLAMVLVFGVALVPLLIAAVVVISALCSLG